MMPARSLDVKLRREPGVAIIDLHGEINASGEAALNAAYEQAVQEGADTILLNFGGVDYINSTGIALIVTVLAQARKSGRRMLAYGLSEHYMEIFQITRLADFMSIFPDEGSALGQV